MPVYKLLLLHIMQLSQKLATGVVHLCVCWHRPCVRFFVSSSTGVRGDLLSVWPPYAWRVLFWCALQRQNVQIFIMWYCDKYSSHKTRSVLSIDTQLYLVCDFVASVILSFQSHCFELSITTCEVLEAVADWYSVRSCTNVACQLKINHICRTWQSNKWRKIKQIRITTPLRHCTLKSPHLSFIRQSWVEASRSNLSWQCNILKHQKQ